MKRGLSLVIVVSLIFNLCISFAFAKDSTDAMEDINFIKLDSRIEDPVDVVQFIDASIDLSEAQVIQTRDSNGKTIYTVQTNSNTATYHEIRLSDLAAAMQKDPLIYDVKLVGNTLTYFMFDGTACSVIEYEGENGSRLFRLREDDREDILTFNSTEQKILLNGAAIEIKIHEEYILWQANVSGSYIDTSSSGWYYYSVSNIDIRAEQVIKNMTTSVLYTLLFYPLGGIGLGMSLALIVIQAAIDYNSLTKSVYVRRTLYRDLNYMSWKYSDNYYLDEDRTEFVTSVETIIYGS
ncbi:hypothetical protein SDC9_78444 [bioreactor metagenome]|uniref:Uncharacterized protein n=1 Tax=bioreactor metagenome TaxID=1076179 RepID=A0A644YUA2_9ZZZZ